MAELATPQTSYVLIGKESTYGTPVTCNKDVGLVQSTVPTLNQNAIMNWGLASSALQDLDWGKVEVGLRLEVAYQHGRLLYYATGGTITHATTGSDEKHTYSLSDTLPSMSLELGHNMATDAVAKYEGVKVQSLTVSLDVTGDLRITTDLVAQSLVTSTTASSSVISTLPKLKGWQGSVSTGAAGSESTLGNVQSFEFTMNNANAGEMRNYKLGSRLVDQAELMGRLMSGKFVVAIQNLNELKRFLSGAAASGTSPTDDGTSPTLAGLVFNAHNGVTLGSGGENGFLLVPSFWKYFRRRSVTHDRWLPRSLRRPAAILVPRSFRGVRSSAHLFDAFDSFHSHSHR